MSHRFSSEVSSISALLDEQVNRQAPEKEKFETPSRREKERLSLYEDIKYHIDLSKHVSVQDKNLRGDLETGTTTFPEQVRVMTYIRASMTQKNLTGDVSITHKI